MKTLRNLVFIILSTSTYYVFTSFSNAKKFEYIYKVEFPESATVFQDTNNPSGFYSDCPVTMRFNITANYPTFSDTRIHPLNITTLSIVDGILFDTISKHFCSGALSEEFYKKIDQPLINITCYPKNKIFKPFSETLGFVSSRDRGRILWIALGNYKGAYSYKITSKGRLSRAELKTLKEYYLQFWINPNQEDKDFLAAPTKEVDAYYNFMFIKQCSIQLVDRIINDK